MSSRRLVGIDLGIASAHTVRVLDETGKTVAKRKAWPTEQSLADVEKTHRENGRTDYDKPIDLKKVIDDQFVDKAIAALGKAKN